MPIQAFYVRFNDGVAELGSPEWWASLATLAQAHPDTEAARLVRLRAGLGEVTPHPPDSGIYAGADLGYYLRSCGALLDEYPEPLQYSVRETAGRWTDVVNAYGVADTVEQALAYLAPITDQADRVFVLQVHKIHREQCGPGSWRWHKWGPYIGDRTPEFKYLHDETAEQRSDGKSIDMVLLFHLFELDPAKLTETHTPSAESSPTTTTT